MARIPKLPKLKKRYWIILSGALLILFAALFLPLQRVFHHYTDQLVRQILTNMVEEQTKGVYHLRYEKLRFNIFTQKLRLYDFHYYPKDTTSLIDFDTTLIKNEFYYGVSIKELELSLDKEWEIFLNDRLDIKSAKIKEPTIKVLNRRVKKKELKIGKMSGDLYQVVTQYLNVFKLQQVAVEDAKMYYYLQTKEFNKILFFNSFSFAIKDFEMAQDMTESKRKLMFTEDFELNSKGQTFLLPDSVHRLSFSRFYLSTAQKKLEFYNFKVEPINDSLPDSIPHVDLYVPEFKLDKIDFVKAYQDNIVEMNELRVSRPAVKVHFTTAKTDTNSRDTATPSVDELIKSTLEKLVIHRLILDEGTIALNQLSEDLTREYVFEGISLQVSELQLDSHLFLDPDPTRMQRNFRVNMEGFQFNIPEENFKVQTGGLDYSSITKVLNCNNLKIHPNEMRRRELLARKSTPILLDSLAIHKIQLANLNIKKLRSRDRLDLYQIKLEKPHVRLSLDTAFFNLPDSVKNQKAQREGVLPIDSLWCRMLQVNQGQIIVNNAHRGSEQFGSLSELDLWLEDLSVNDLLSNQMKPEQWLDKTSMKAGPSKLFVPDLVEDLTWQRIGFDKNEKTFYTYGLVFEQQDAHRNLRMEFPEIQIQLDDPKKLLSKGDKKFRSVKLVDPRLVIRDSLRNPSKGKPDLPFSRILTDSLVVENGYIKTVFRNRIENHVSGLSVTSGQTELARSDTGRPIDWSIQNLGISFDQSNFLIDNKRHRLVTGKCNYSRSDSLFYLADIRIDPLKSARGSDGGPLVKARIDYANFETLFAGTNTSLDTIQTGEISFCNASLDVDLYTGRDQAKSGRGMFELHQWLEEVTGIRKLSYDALSLENANLRARIHNIKDPKKNWLIKVDQYDITSSGFDVTPGSQHSDRNLFYARDYSLHAYGIQQIFPDTTDYLSMRELHYSTEDRYIQFKDSKFGYLVKDGKTGEQRYYIEGNVPEIEVEGLRPYDARKQKRVILDRLHLNNPVLDITQFHKNSESVSRELDMDRGFKEDSLAVDQLLLRELQLDKGYITWQFDDTMRDPIRINHLHIKGSELSYDNDSEEEKKLPRFDALQISFGDFRHDVMKDFYELELDSVNLNTEQQNLMLGGVRLNPNYGIFEFGQVAGWEKSRLELFLNQVDISGLQTKKLIYDQELRASLISADSLWIRNFKDKRLGMIDRNMPLPVTGLQRLPITVQVDSAELKSGIITHLQLSKNGVKPGKIYFTELQGTVANITNDPKRIEKNGTMLAIASTKLMGEGLIEANIQFDLNDSNGSFTTDAHVGSFEATSLNEFTEHTAYIGIKSGTVNESEITFRSNDEYSIGSMKLLYEDLHVEFLNRKDPDHKGMGLAMKAFLANRLVNTKNPHFFITKKGDIYYVRDTTRVIFDYLSKSAMSGVVSSVGVRSNRKYIKKVKKEQLRREKAIRREEEEEEEQSAEASSESGPE